MFFASWNPFVAKGKEIDEPEVKRLEIKPIWVLV
jgi:hypothetical protein